MKNLYYVTNFLDTYINISYLLPCEYIQVDKKKYSQVYPINRFRFMLFNVTFNSISVISVSFIRVEETGLLGKIHQTVASHRQTWSHNVVSSIPRHGLYCLMPLLTIFQLYRGGQFYWWRKPDVPGENHRHVSRTDKVITYVVQMYRVHLAWAGFELSMLVVIGTDCTGSCKSNYHTIKSMTTPDHSE